jgi:hypothetical protein
MGRPLILYGVEELDNHSFEDDAPGPFVPTGWDDSLGSNEILEVTTAEFHSPGIGFPSTQSVRQNTLSGAGGSKAVLRQRTAAADAVGFLKLYGSGEIAAAALLKGVDQRALDNASIAIEQYSGGTSAPGSGVLLAPAASRSIVAGAGPWYLRVAAETIHASAAWVDVILTYDIAVAGYNAASNAYWDRVYVGAVFDLVDKGFREVSDRVQTGVAVNMGNKVAEVVRFTAAQTRLDLSLRNVLVNHGTIDPGAKRFSAWLGSPYVGRVVLWVDRDRSTNDAHHYTHAFHDDQLRVDIRPGVEYRHYDYRFNVNGEVP